MRAAASTRGSNSGGSSAAAGSGTVSPSGSTAMAKVVVSVPYTGRKGSRVTNQGRQVTVTKFDPRQISSVSAKSDAKSRVAVGVAPDAAKHTHRWPEKTIYKKDIEAKPWYSRSFDEVVELYCGDEIRAEKYPTFNKSFVTKIKADSRPPQLGFGRRLEPTPRASPRIPKPTMPSSPKGAVSDRTSAGNLPPALSPRSQATRPPAPPARPTPATALTALTDEDIEREVRTRHLRTRDLQALLASVDAQIVRLEANAKHDHAVIQRLLADTHKSDTDLRDLRRYAASILTEAQQAVKALVATKQQPQRHMRRLEEESRVFAEQHGERLRALPLARMQRMIAEEERRAQLRARVLAILRAFVALLRGQGLLFRGKKLPSVRAVVGGVVTDADDALSPRRPHLYKKRVMADSTRRSVYEWKPAPS